MRRAARTLLLGLPLLLGLAAGAQAQTPMIDSTEITEGETKTFTVTGIPTSWTGDIDVHTGGTATIHDCDLATLPGGGGVPNWDVCENASAASYNQDTRIYTFELRARADSVDEPDETITIRLQDSDDGSRRVTFTITLREPPTATLTPLGGTTLPEGAGATFNVVLTRALGPAETVKLPLTIGGTATRGEDYRIVCIDASPAGSATCNDIDGDSPSITFNGAYMTSERTTGPLRLETIEDNTVEANETVTLQLGDGRAREMTITEAPSSVTVSFTKGSFSAAEDAGQFQPVFRLNKAAGRDLEIPLIYADVTATSGTDYTPVASVTIKATGSLTSSFDIPIIDDNVQEKDETFTVEIDTTRLPDWVTAGSITRATFTITDNDPLQILLSQDYFELEEPQADNCSDDKVGTEKTFGTDPDDGHPTVTRNYGPVLTRETYQVKLGNSPGAGKYVSVEIWEPTDLDRPATGRFSENASIHGISWEGGRQGRISIAKSHLTFTDKNWNQPQTVTVNIHCAQHDVNNPLPIWHFAFRHDDRVINPGSDYQHRPSDSVHAAGSNRKGDNTRANTSLKIAQVRVADRTEPAAITGNVDGKLVLDAGSGPTIGGKEMIDLEFVWNHPDNSLGNDYDDANAQFAAFRVKLRTVEPAGHPVQEKIVLIDDVSGKPKTAVGWYAALEAKGHVGWVHGRPEPADSKYEWSVVPLDRHWNEVTAEKATQCVLLTSRAGPNGGRASRIDETANPTCDPAPPPTAADGGICGRTQAVRDAIVGKVPGVSHCRDVTPEHLAFVTGTLDLQNTNLSGLQAGDLDGLTALTKLTTHESGITTLPAGIFDDLTALTELVLSQNQIGTLPAGIFDRLTKLERLDLNGRRAFFGQTRRSNISTLTPGIFDRLTKLEWLDLHANSISTLPAGIFDRLTKLGRLDLAYNNINALPDGIFDKLTSLSGLVLNNNPGTPFTQPADAGPDQTVATGAEVTLSGSTETGPWGDNLRLRWFQVDGPTSNTLVHNDIISGAGGVFAATHTFTAPSTPGELHFRLVSLPRAWNTNRGTNRTYDWVTITVGGGGQSSPQQTEAAPAEEPACVSPSLMADVETRIANASSTAGTERWTSVRAALTGQANAITLAEVKAIHARRTQHGWSTAQWDPVIEAMECLANPPQEEQPAQAEEEQAPPATPELSLSAGSAVDEGGNATFTVTANPAPTTDLTIAWTVAQSGDYLDAPGAGSRTATLTAGSTSIALSVATVDDAADETDGSVSVTLGAGTGYTVATGKGSAAVAVRDNDEPVVSIAAGSGVTEGAAASFTVSASPVPAAPLDVTLSVGQSGDFAASGETGSRTVTVPVTGSLTFEVDTEDDGADEADGSITATMGTGTGYTVAAAPDNAASVAVSDNDAAAAASGPTISIADATMKENWRNGYFTVTLSEPVDWPVSVHYATRDSSPVSAVAGEDYLAWQRSWQLRARFQPGQTETQIHVRLYNDSHDEDPETFEMVLFDAAVNGPPGVSVSIADGVAVGTITNDDPMPAAWLARFGRTAAEQALDGIAGRIAAPRGAGVQGTIAGQALSFDPGSQSGAANDNAGPGSLAGNDLLAQSEVARAFGAGHGGFGSGGPDGFGPLGFGQDRFGGGGAQSRSMTGREALLGSSFTATGEKDGTGGSLAFWGRAAQSSFDGREGTFSLDGEATTAMLGADYARGNWLVGMALMQSSGEGGYADRESGPQHCPDVGEGMDPAAMAHLCGGAVREGDGKVEASLTAAVPYAAIQASERLKLWGAAGHGTGEVTLKPEVGGSLTADISWTMAAAGLRGDVIAPPTEGSGPALAVTSDALWARTSSDKTHELAASDSDVTRLRLGLEGSWRIATEGDGSITPKLELGVRQDGGDAETGSGMELGAGIAWSDPGAGLSLDLSGRTLITHTEEDLENEGFSVSFHYDPKPASARGLELSLRQEIGGPSTGGLDALFASEPLSERSDSDEESRLKLEAAYGFPVFSGQYIGTPGVSFVRGSASRDYSLGWHFTPAKSTIGISFGIRATRRESEGADPQHAVGGEASVRW